MKKIAILLGVVLFINAGSAFAGPLDITDIVGAWLNAQPGGITNLNINNVTNQGTDTVRWGDPATSLGQSGYNFTPGGDIISAALGTPFLLGTFEHVNQPIFGTPLGSIDYNFSFDTNGIPANLATSFHFVHDETPNDLPCDAGPEGASISVCDDFVTVSTLGINQLITVGTDVYFFNLLGFSKDGGATIRTGFQSQENGTSRAGLYGVVTAQPIPEPSTLLLLLAGLGGITAATRRMRRS
jgi:hypothetical protein